MKEVLSKAELDSMLALHGVTKRDLAAVMKVSPAYVSKITKDPVIEERHAIRIKNALRQVLLKRTMEAYPDVVNYSEIP